MLLWVVYPVWGPILDGGLFAAFVIRGMSHQQVWDHTACLPNLTLPDVLYVCGVVGLLV